MEMMELMKQRHSVRQYENKKIEPKKRAILLEAMEDINVKENLHLQLLFDETRCFDSFIAHYGAFSGVANYIALVGTKSPSLDETCGYHGERLVLLAQELGLNTCWAALSHGKSAAEIQKQEKQTCLIALGYGKNQGVMHKNKPLSEICNAAQVRLPPPWFSQGIAAALLAPTAMNQQKFYFSLDGDTITAKVKGRGLYTKMDLGIVKYHFEAVSGHKVK